MARHKFASNVCEKALITSTPEMRRALIDEIVTPKHEGANNVMMMMRDQYASKQLSNCISPALWKCSDISSLPRLRAAACFIGSRR